ncbi:hypothetical protein CBS101457_006100 [Exobasidium rhododendri]|nr:hypothetical protein CBS101457_006100 [Exobasidium rhododendri]
METDQGSSRQQVHPIVQHHQSQHSSSSDSSNSNDSNATGKRDLALSNSGTNTPLSTSNGSVDVHHYTSSSAASHGQGSDIITGESPSQPSSMITSFGSQSSLLSAPNVEPCLQQFTHHPPPTRHQLHINSIDDHNDHTRPHQTSSTHQSISRTEQKLSGKAATAMTLNHDGEPVSPSTFPLFFSTTNTAPSTNAESSSLVLPEVRTGHGSAEIPQARKRLHNDGSDARDPRSGAPCIVDFGRPRKDAEMQAKMNKTAKHPNGKSDGGHLHFAAASIYTYVPFELQHHQHRLSPRHLTYQMTTRLHRDTTT